MLVNFSPYLVTVFCNFSKKLTSLLLGICSESFTSMLKSSTLWSTVNFAPYRVTVFFNFSKKPISLFGICWKSWFISMLKSSTLGATTDGAGFRPSLWVSFGPRHFTFCCKVSQILTVSLRAILKSSVIRVIH